MLWPTSVASCHSPQVGPPLSQHQQVVDCLLHLLGTYRYDQAEELVLNCVCALTNLSFYHGGQGNKVRGRDLRFRGLK